MNLSEAQDHFEANEARSMGTDEKKKAYQGSPPTKKMREKEFAHFEGIKLIQPIKIEEGSVNFGSPL